MQLFETFAKKRQRRGEAGLALVEFALVVPMLMLLLVGSIETGRFMYYSILVGNAARAGVQYGSLSLTNANDNTGINAAATNDGQNASGLSASGGLVCSCWNGTAAIPTDCSQQSCSLAGYNRIVYVQVTATMTLTPLFNYPGLPSSYNLTRQAVMRVQQ